MVGEQSDIRAAFLQSSRAAFHASRPRRDIYIHYYSLNRNLIGITSRRRRQSNLTAARVQHAVGAA